MTAWERGPQLFPCRHEQLSQHGPRGFSVFTSQWLQSQSSFRMSLNKPGLTLMINMVRVKKPLMNLSAVKFLSLRFDKRVVCKVIWWIDELHRVLSLDSDIRNFLKSHLDKCATYTHTHTGCGCVSGISRQGFSTKSACVHTQTNTHEPRLVIQDIR